jgi:rhodanese-related sulfurtransferase
MTTRLDPREAYERVRAGAVLVDIRPRLYRLTEGVIPGALIIDGAELERRLDPASPTCLSVAAYDLEVIVVCNEGRASRVAADALHNVGLAAATDLAGGYRAWRAAGLPVAQAHKCRSAAAKGQPVDALR